MGFTRARRAAHLPAEGADRSACWAASLGVAARHGADARCSARSRSASRAFAGAVHLPLCPRHLSITRSRSCSRSWPRRWRRCFPARRAARRAPGRYHARGGVSRRLRRRRSSRVGVTASCPARCRRRWCRTSISRSSAASSSASPGRRARASPRCSTCWACSTGRPRARCWIDGEDTTGFDEDRARRGSAWRSSASCSSSTSCCRSSPSLDNVPLPMRKLGAARRRRHAGAGRGCCSIAWPGGSARQAAGPAVRRPAPARGDRPRARQRPARDPAPTSRPATSTPFERATCRHPARPDRASTNKTVVAVTHDAQFAAPADRRIGSSTAASTWPGGRRDPRTRRWVLHC